MDPVKDLTLSEDSEVSGTPASNHKHHSWQWCGWKKKSPWSSTHSLWCFCSGVHCPGKKVQGFFFFFKLKKNQAWHSQIITIWLSILCFKKFHTHTHTHIYLITFFSEKLGEEASDNDNMKQVWEIMALWEENTSKRGEKESQTATTKKGRSLLPKIANCSDLK